MQTELEETKAQETAKLQEALKSMQIQVEEANARALKEREAARKAIEEAPPVIKETPIMVQDMAKIEALTAEIEILKVRLSVTRTAHAEYRHGLGICIDIAFLAKTRVDVSRPRPPSLVLAYP